MINKKFNQYISKFEKIAHIFDVKSAQEKLKTLELISKTKFENNKYLLSYHTLLLFSITHAENKKIVQIATNELDRLAIHLSSKKNAENEIFDESGLPFSPMTTRFSQDAFNQLVKHKNVDIKFDSLNNDSFDLNTFLNISLPNVLKEETSAALSNQDLMRHLGVIEGNEFDFLLQQINKIDCSPLAKDYMWQALQSFFIIRGKDKFFSKTFNKLKSAPQFLTQNLIKKFDHLQQLKVPIPKPKILTTKEKENIINVIELSMPLSMREIDPTTYMDTDSLIFFDLDRGMQMALYGMKANRQLPMRSYIGYTMFKNGYPVSYGGSWVFGRSSLFALNIFEEFRGGESKYIMTEILRVYIQTFGITYFEVEPFQFGNEDALATGAFWFYYKFGFRSTDVKLQKLAEKEVIKINKSVEYKTNIETLKKFAEQNLYLLLEKKKPQTRTEIMEKMLAHIAEKHKGNAFEAIDNAKNLFLKKIKKTLTLNIDEEKVFEEIALWAEVMNIKDEKKLNLMTEMISAKISNFKLYNELIIKFFEH